METKQTIGELIEKEVRKQGRSITQFADDICCQRSNVYDIFKRSKMDVTQLALISKVLNHNFFKDLADDPGLINLSDPETEKELINRKAVSMFMTVMPEILKKLGMDPMIIFSKFDEDDVPLPDLGLSQYPIFFTIGEPLIEKWGKQNLGGILEVREYKTESGFIVDFWHRNDNNFNSIDIPLIYRSENEWMEIMSFVKENFLPYLKYD